MVNAFFCRDGVATGFANLYGIDDSGCLRGPGLTYGFRGDRMALKSWVMVGSFIVNALKQNRSVSIGGAGRVKSSRTCSNRRTRRSCIHNVCCSTSVGGCALLVEFSATIHFEVDEVTLRCQSNAYHI